MNVLRNLLTALAAFCMLCFALPSVAQSKPHWVSKKEAKFNKERSNDTYEFIKVENFGADINVLRQERLETLAFEIAARNGHNGSNAVIEPIGEADNFGCYREARIIFEHPQRSVYQVYLIDDHEVFEDNFDLTFDFTLYQIYAVSRCNVTPLFDDFNIVKSDNKQALVLSLVPGMGQLYKEQKVKAYTIWGIEAGLIAASIIFENERSRLDRIDKIKGNRHSRVVGYEEFRNLSLIAAGVVYVYNLVDAAVSKGPRRLEVNKRNDASVSLAPAVFRDGAGVTFSLNF